MTNPIQEDEELRKVSDLKGTGYFQTIDHFPAPAPEPTGDLSSQLIEALSRSSHGFHSSQLEAIMPIIKAHTEQKAKQVHDDLTDNERKVWLYREDLERRLLEARGDELTKTFTQVIGDKETPSSRYSKVTRIFNTYLKKRHAELQDQLNKLEGK